MSIKIYDYSCIKSYLGDLFRELKNEKSYFSYGYLAQKLNWHKTFFPDVLSGRRSLPLKKLVELIKWLDLPEEEGEYLILLWLKESQFSDVEEFFLQKMDKFKKNLTQDVNSEEDSSTPWNMNHSDDNQSTLSH